MEEKNLALLSDEDIITIVCNKDQECYKEIVLRYQKKLLNYAYYILHNQDEAIDAVQESFIKAFVNLKGFDTKKKFSSWIYRIVHNEAMNMIKKRKKSISFEENEWTEGIADNNESQEDEFSKKEIQIIINDCLKEMPVNYREALMLFYLEEKSYNEISDILRMPIGTVGTKITRGKAILKKIWNKKAGGYLYE